MALSNENNSPLPESETSSQSDIILTPPSSSTSTSSHSNILDNASDRSESTIDLTYPAVGEHTAQEPANNDAQVPVVFNDDSLQVRLQSLPQRPNPDSRIRFHTARVQQDIDRVERAFQPNPDNHHNQGE